MPIAATTGPGGDGGGGATPPEPRILLSMLVALHMLNVLQNAFAIASKSASDNLSNVAPAALAIIKPLIAFAVMSPSPADVPELTGTGVFGDGGMVVEHTAPPGNGMLVCI